MKIKLFLLLLSVLITTASFAQNKTIKGLLLNDKGEPVGGANVVESGNEKNGTSTDATGHFTITLRGNNLKVKISYSGFLPREITLQENGLNVFSFQLDNKGLDDVVIVGFGRQKKITSTGAVSSIGGKDIKAIPTSSVQNTLAGRLPGFFSTQRSGQPGADAADFFIRGVNSLSGDNKPLIVVDDIEYDYSQLSQINANEIETISILKDASTTSIYGLKGANGVLVVTTTRGKIGKPRVNVTIEGGINKVIKMPTYLNSYTTAILRNEATINDAYGLSQVPVLPFTADDLQKFKDGSDPIGHPNVNWVDATLNNTSRQDRYNVDFSGGNSFVKYFTSLGYFSEDGILKQFDPIGDYVNTNYSYKRYNYRSNLDITPTKTLKLRFDVNGRFETINNPGGLQETAAGFFYELSAFRYTAPYAMPLLNPNGTYSYANHQGAVANAGAVNPIYRMANGGYRRNFNNNYNIVVGADQKLDFITRGLSAKINVSYAGNTNETRNLLRTGLPAYKYTPATNSYTLRSATENRIPVYGLAVSNAAFNGTTVLQAYLNYDRTFLNAHHFTGLFLLNKRSYTNGGAIPVNYLGTTGRIDYDYKRKYLVGVTLARNGNDLFRKENRYGIFPAMSFGYNLSEEKAFKQLFPFFDLFKIRGSYGLVGTDVSYPSTVTSVIQYNTTGTNYYGNTTTEGSLVNPDVTWEKERKTDIGIEINMLNGKLSLSGSYFYNYRYDQLIDQGDVPLIIGQTLPKRNIGITENKGFDGIITYKDKIGKVNFSVSGNVSYAINNAVYVSEAPDYPYLARTGRQLNLTLGYHNLGFYQLDDFGTDGKVKKGIPAPTWSVIQPGDIKYADLNNDGVINDADRTYIGKPNLLPTTNFGAEFTVSYKAFSLRALVQAATGYNVQITAEGAGDAFNGNLRPWNLERWTPATASTATYPRIGLNSSINNISYQTVSDFWFVDASYIRLKSLEVGYQVPAPWLVRTKVIQNARIYCAGYNLLNINNMSHFQQDAEVASGTGAAYPNTANFNLGIQLGF
jgi:TonB-linked SusC/RagA family outer membrane protein